jgi:hypothetical protein
MEEPGLDLHEWETRWQELQEAAADEPVATLPEVVRLVRQMLEARGFELDEPITVQGEDADIVRQFQAAREIAAVIDADEAVEVEDALEQLEGLRDVYDYLVQDRAPP